MFWCRVWTSTIPRSFNNLDCKDDFVHFHSLPETKLTKYFTENGDVIAFESQFEFGSSDVSQLLVGIAVDSNNVLPGNQIAPLSGGIVWQKGLFDFSQSRKFFVILFNPFLFLFILRFYASLASSHNVRITRRLRA